VEEGLVTCGGRKTKPSYERKCANSDRRQEGRNCPTCQRAFVEPYRVSYRFGPVSHFNVQHGQFQTVCFCTRQWHIPVCRPAICRYSDRQPCQYSDRQPSRQSDRPCCAAELQAINRQDRFAPLRLVLQFAFPASNVGANESLFAPDFRKRGWKHPKMTAWRSVNSFGDSLLRDSHPKAQPEPEKRCKLQEFAFRFFPQLTASPIGAAQRLPVRQKFYYSES
jgi:hypothetical protein